MSCIVAVEGCQRCADHPRQRDPGHRCSLLCHLRQRSIATPAGHAAHHQPLRHRCGTVLDERHGDGRRAAPRQCPFGRCTQYFCPGCRRFDMGWGPILCPCETGRHGHDTYAEFPRPSVTHLVKHRGRRGR